MTDWSQRDRYLTRFEFNITNNKLIIHVHYDKPNLVLLEGLMVRFLCSALRLLCIHVSCEMI